MYLNTTVKIPEIKGKIITKLSQRKKELQLISYINTEVNTIRKNNMQFR